jgi:hypothetical protein
MGNLSQDLRYALRQFQSSVGFSLTAVLTLAFGIGASTAIFSIVEGVLLRPLPFPNQANLVVLADIVEGVDYDGDTPGVTSYGVRTYMRDTRAFSSLGGYQPSTYELSGMGDLAQIDADGADSAKLAESFAQGPGTPVRIFLRKPGGRNRISFRLVFQDDRQQLRPPELFVARASGRVRP